jgi:hypothetical protein
LYVGFADATVAGLFEARFLNSQKSWAARLTNIAECSATSERSSGSIRETTEGIRDHGEESFYNFDGLRIRVWVC